MNKDTDTDNIDEVTTKEKYFFTTLFVVASVIMGYLDISGYGWFILLAFISFFCSYKNNNVKHFTMKKIYSTLIIL